MFISLLLLFYLSIDPNRDIYVFYDFTDILAYEKSVNSKPDVSCRGSPIKSILKPSAVSSPINPFYFPNGERKLKRKRK